jgi:hypothetical protein
MSDDSMRPDMTWAAAIPKAEPETADSLAPNPDGFMEMNDLPLMLDVVSMLNALPMIIQSFSWRVCLVMACNVPDFLVTSACLSNIAGGHVAKSLFHRIARVT